jgi:hypothetical protein
MWQFTEWVPKPRTEQFGLVMAREWPENGAKVGRMTVDTIMIIHIRRPVTAIRSAPNS